MEIIYSIRNFSYSHILILGRLLYFPSNQEVATIYVLYCINECCYTKLTKTLETGTIMFLYFCDNFFLFCEKERKNFALTKKNIFHSKFISTESV